MLNTGRPVGGALDDASIILANRLIGNEEEEPCLEITMTGPTILFESAAIISITGARFEVFLDGQEVDLDARLSVQKDQILKFGKLLSGCRAYVAIRGSWDRNKMDWSQNSLKSGSRCFIRHRLPIYYSEKINFHFQVRNKIGIMPGPEFYWFTEEAREIFVTQSWKILAIGNRMALTLSGNPLPISNKQNLISSGTIPGTIQVNNSGMPMVLLNDAQLTGGYPRIAVIKKTDLQYLAQLRGGDTVLFYWM
jgi:antagonist of KipI